MTVPLLALLAFALAAEPVPLPPPPLPGQLPTRTKVLRLAVSDFTATGVEQGTARALAEVAAAEAASVGGFTVITQGEIASMLGLERTRQLLACTESSSCLLEIAGALDVDGLLAGEVTLVDGTALLAVRHLDARRARTLARKSEALRNPSQSELLDASRRLTHEALTGQRLETSGALVVAVAEPGAQVSVDGRVVGTTPGLAPLKVPEGRHELTVTKPGYITWRSSASVRKGERATVDVRLVRLPDPGGGGKVLGWTGVTAGVASLALGGAAIWQGLESNRHYDAARKLQGPAGDLVAGASPGSFRAELAAGSDGRDRARVLGIGAGAAALSGVVMGYIAYRQTGEVGPFRF